MSKKNKKINTKRGNDDNDYQDSLKLHLNGLLIHKDSLDVNISYSENEIRISKENICNLKKRLKINSKRIIEAKKAIKVYEQP